jgi:hypothetical protein
VAVCGSARGEVCGRRSAIDSDVWQCGSACVEVQQCAAVRQCLAVRGSVWQCVWQCVAECLAVCGSAHGSVGAVRVAVCGSALGRVRQSDSACVAVRQGAAVQQCAAMRGNARWWQCNSV